MLEAWWETGELGLLTQPPQGQLHIWVQPMMGALGGRRQPSRDAFRLRHKTSIIQQEPENLQEWDKKSNIKEATHSGSLSNNLILYAQS